MTIAKQIADYSLELNYHRLPQDVIHAAKRSLLDTIGCAIGGYTSEASQIYQSLVTELGKSTEATIIGSGIKTDCLNATMANGIMVRYLDYMDQISIPVGQWYVFTHPSEVIPSILAVSEWKRLSGKDVLTAIVLGYELLARFSEASSVVPMSKKGWNSDTSGAYVVPAVVGKLLGLDAPGNRKCHRDLGLSWHDFGHSGQCFGRIQHDQKLEVSLHSSGRDFSRSTGQERFHRSEIGL
jgi:2-methylcitrate dehydratase